LREIKMNIETSISIPDKIYRKNSIDIGVAVNVDLSDYKIHAEVFDRFYSSIRLNTEDNGGSDDEIEIVDADKGTFVLHIAKGQTELFHLYSYLEIILIDEDGKEFTAYFGVIKFQDDMYMRVVR
jgi:hypothetical protein